MNIKGLFIRIALSLEEAHSQMGYAQECHKRKKRRGLSVEGKEASVCCLAREFMLPLGNVEFGIVVPSFLIKCIFSIKVILMTR